MEKSSVPTAQLGKYKSLLVERKTVQPTKEQMEDALRIVRYQNAQWEKETGPAKKADLIELDFAGFFPGGIPIPDSETKGARVILGQGKMLPGVEDAICGHCVGETFSIPVTYPDNFPLRSLANREVEFTVVLHQVMRKNMPQATDAFARKLGYADFKALYAALEKEQLEKNEQAETQRIETVLLAQAGAELQVNFPDGYLERAAEQRVATMEKDLQQAGREPSLYYRLTGHDREWYLQRAALEIEVDWRRRLVIREIAKAENISVSKAEVQQERAHLTEEKQPIESLTDEALENALLSQKIRHFLAAHAVYNKE